MPKHKALFIRLHSCGFLCQLFIFTPIYDTLTCLNMNIGQWRTVNGMILRPPYTRQHVAGNKLLSDKLPYTRQLVASIDSRVASNALLQATSYLVLSNKLPRIESLSIFSNNKLPRVWGALGYNNNYYYYPTRNPICVPRLYAQKKYSTL